MSLSHGHFYMAGKLRDALDGPLQRIVSENPNEYQLGAIAPDVLYWSDDISLNRLMGTNMGDPHIGDTGNFILHLFETALFQMGRGNPAPEPFMAFAVGWVTHWAADLYIHSLVNKYGGHYVKFPSRHLQLELVETKYIHEKNKNKKVKENFEFRNSELVWLLIEDAFVSAQSAEEIGRFSEPISRNWIGLAILKAAYIEAEEACISARTDIGIPLEYEKLVVEMRRLLRSNFGDGLEDLVNELWSSHDGFIPSDETYEELMNPIDVSVMSARDYLDVEVTIADTGLYGKFLVDYEAFILGAVAKALSISSIVNDYLIHIGIQPTTVLSTDSRSDWEKLGFRDRLRKELYDSSSGVECPVNILLPEPHWPMLAADNPAIKAVLGNDEPEAYANARPALFCELEVYFAEEELPLVTFPVVIRITGKNHLYESERAEASFRIPINNPENSPYFYKLKISLGITETPFESKYEDIEYTCVEGIHTDIEMITTATRIEVGYKGPVSSASDDKNRKNPSLQIPGLAMPAPERKIVVDEMGDHENVRDVQLYWQDNHFTAEFTEEHENRPVAQPGCPQEPVCGRMTRTIRISGTADFICKVVTFEAEEIVTDYCKHEEIGYQRNSRQHFSAANVQVLELQEDGNMIRFGVDSYKTMVKSSAQYTNRSTSTGMFVYTNWEKDEVLANDKSDQQDRCLYIEFRR